MLTELIVPAVKENSLETYLFSHHESKSDPSKNFSIVDVLMATTAAPTFFPSYKIDNEIFIDGGVNLNNPSMSAYSEAIKYGIDQDKIFVLSMGTGSFIPDPLDPDLCRGKLFWAKNFHRVALSAQEANTDLQMYNILGNRYQRWQVWMDEPIGLDAYENKNLENLVEMARQYIEELNDSDDNKLNKMIEFLTEDNFQF